MIIVSKYNWWKLFCQVLVSIIIEITYKITLILILLIKKVVTPRESATAFMRHYLGRKT